MVGAKHPSSPLKSADLHNQSNRPPHLPNLSSSLTTSSPLVSPTVSVPHAITMNNPEFYSNSDDVTSAPWPNPPDPWAMGDYSYTSVPQSTHPDFTSTPGYLSTAGGPYVPDFNAADDAAFTLALMTDSETGPFTNLPTRVDCAYRVSKQHISTSRFDLPCYATEHS